ncbi:helix-turn-helix transcriptional regulator, partial [Streptomyces sp. 3R004]|nr:helix-turn-helix transcriptional regulator [Streptomyces justiciae]
AGHFDQAQRLLRSARAPGAAASPASVVTSAYVALFEDGDVRHTHRQVSAAIEQLRDRGVREPDEVLTRLIDLLLAISQYAGSPARWAETRAVLGELAPARSLVYQDAWGDVVRHGAGVRERVEREFAAVADLAPWDVTRLAVAAYHVDTLSQYRTYLHRSADREAETGFVRNGMTTRHLIMLDQMTVG